jgi:hypothetical protein
VFPLEVIDGQHRLWAFGDGGIGDDLELPVVAFAGLDRRWQAYLFWTINITPKRINASLAYDLYPLLRAEQWLERFEGHSVYRESRAQELVEALWAYPGSPWYQRINMLGEGRVGVSQAAWVRSLLATFIRPWRADARSGGLFGAPTGEDELVLPWSRAQQAALLVALWSNVARAVRRTNRKWAVSLRGVTSLPAASEDDAFSGSQTLLNSDQGVRAVMHVANDILFHRAVELGLGDWQTDVSDAPATDFDGLTAAFDQLTDLPVGMAVVELADDLASYYFRTFSAPDLSEREKERKAGFRGSGGYRQLRLDLLKHLIETSKGSLKEASAIVRAQLADEPEPDT